MYPTIRKTFAFGMALLAFLFIPISAQEKSKGPLEEYNQALKLYGEGKYEEAVQALKSLIIKSPDFDRAYDKLVQVYKEKKGLDEGAHYFEHLLSENPKNAYAHYGLGLVYKEKKEYNKALEHLEEALKIKPEMIEGYRTRGDIFYKSSRFADAFKEYEKMAEIAEQRGDLENKGSAFKRIGNVYWKLGSYAQGLTSYQKGLKISQLIGDREEEGKLLNNIGVVYRELRSYRQARDYFERSLKIKRKIGSREGEGATLDNIGNILQGLGRCREALKYYRKSLKIRQQREDREGEGKLLNNIGVCYRDLGQYQRALDYHRRSLEIFREIGDRQHEGFTLIGRGMVYSDLGEYQKAVEDQRLALGIANSSEGIWSSHYGLAQALEKQGKLSEALEHYKASIQTIEDVRGRLQLEEEKLGFFNDKIAVYKNLISLLVRFGDKDYDRRAYYYLERARARALGDLLAEASIDSTRGLDAGLLEKKRLILARLKKASREKDESQLSKLDEEYQEIMREIKKRNPEYAALVYPETVDLDQAQKLLDEDTVLLEYSIGEKDSWLFAVTRDRLRIFPLPEQKALDRKIVGFKKGDKNIPGFRDALTGDPNVESNLSFVISAHSLYKLLLKPAEKIFQGRKQLIIVPDGSLTYLPFQVLLDKGVTIRGQIDFSQLPYLVRKYSIYYAPSATVLKNLLERKKRAPAEKRKSFVAFADPVYPLEKANKEDKSPEQSSGLIMKSAGIDRLKRLYNSGIEAEKISELFPPQDVRLYLGEKATVANVKSENLTQYQYVHFATHAISNEEEPHQSSLILTVDERSKADGILQLREIYDLRLNADLVVLSACNTGSGKLVSGEGLIGLTRGFMYAGTPSVLASLWAIYDETTAELMHTFYTGLRSEDKAAALRQAQLQMIKKGRLYSHPHYWGPFVLFGER